MKQKKRGTSKSKRKAFTVDIVTAVLTESGYRCAVPTCRGILALDIHHMVEVSEGGGNILENLLPLCPTCHALYHRKVISKESIYTWKAWLVSLTSAFDLLTIDYLLFLKKSASLKLKITGDGVLLFSRLVASGLADYQLETSNGPLFLYSVKLSTRGDQLISAWQLGKREDLKQLPFLSGQVVRKKTKP